MVISQELALIQGPPGTGKSFVGLRLVEVLLRNRDRWAARGAAAAPLVVICYTNRALGELCPYLLNHVLDRSGILRNYVHILKRQSNEIFYLRFFHR